MADSAAAPVVQSEINGSSGNSEEDISKDTLLSLLKDKSKEIKLLSTKLTKLEEKYVKTLKESKPIKKDHDSLLRFLFNDVFSAEPYMLSPQPSVGEFEYNTLQQAWAKRESHINAITASHLEKLNREKQEDKSKFDKLVEESQMNAKYLEKNQNLAETIQKYETQLYELQEKNSKSLDSITELNSLLEQKSHTISNLRKVEEKMHQQQAELLLRELNTKGDEHSLTHSLEKHIEKSAKIDEILKVKHQLDKAIETNFELEKRLALLANHNETLKLRIDSLEIELQEEKKTVETLSIQAAQAIADAAQTQTDINGSQKFAEVEQSSEISPASRVHQALVALAEQPPSQSQNSQASSQRTSATTAESNESINHEYLKNVILKYFIYSEGKAYNEASVLMAAIMTILKMSKEDRERVNAARLNATLWNSTKSFISSTFSFSQNPDVVDYTKK